MQATDLVKKILAERGLSKAAMAHMLGIDPSMPSNWVSGKREPGPVQCLLLASLASTHNEREFWIAKAGMDSTKLKMVAEALSLPTPAVLSGEEHQLIDFWRNAQTPIERSMREMLQVLLMQRNTPMVLGSTGTNTIERKGDIPLSIERAALLKIKELAEEVLSGEEGKRYGTGEYVGAGVAEGVSADIAEIEDRLREVPPGEDPPAPPDTAGRKSGRARRT